MEQTQLGNMRRHCRPGCFCAAWHSRLEGLLSIVSKVVLNLLTDKALVLVLQDLHSTAQHTTAWRRDEAASKVCV